jgi:MOSC domain-containing protein YiiM
MSTTIDCAELESQLELRPDILKKPAGRWGVVAAIFVGPQALEPMAAVPEVVARAGAGLAGDRYSREAGTFSKASPTNQLTLVEEEALAAAARDYGLAIHGAETRRNLLTCGISLNHLVGREFRIGDVRVRGLKLCEPCAHLEKLTGKEVIKALRHRGGLRAEILTDGRIKVGDVITERE